MYAGKHKCYSGASTSFGDIWIEFLLPPLLLTALTRAIATHFRLNPF